MTIKKSAIPGRMEQAMHDECMNHRECNEVIQEGVLRRSMQIVSYIRFILEHEPEFAKICTLLGEKRTQENDALLADACRKAFAKHPSKFLTLFKYMELAIGNSSITTVHAEMPDLERLFQEHNSNEI